MKEWNSAIHPQKSKNSQGIILSHMIHLKFYFPSLLITSTIATMVHIKHETSQLKMVHLSQFIQVRNPKKNMKKFLNSIKNIRKQQPQFFFNFLYIKIVKCQNKTKNRK